LLSFLIYKSQKKQNTLKEIFSNKKNEPFQKNIRLTVMHTRNSKEEGHSFVYTKSFQSFTVNKQFVLFIYPKEKATNKCSLFKKVL